MTRELFAALEAGRAGRHQGVTSTITVMELTDRPWGLGRSAIAREYEALLVHFPNLALAEATRDVARRAAQLRAHHRVRPADALQVATALDYGATAFVTNDRALARLYALLDVIVLENLAQRCLFSP